MRRWIFVLLPFFCLAQEPIAKCVSVEGRVFAAREEEEERPLLAEAVLFEGDKIRTEEEGRAQIQFTDGALILLSPQTLFQVTKYRYKKLLQSDQFSSELFQGSVQLLTGSIAKKNPKDTFVKTPNATLGLRGTVIEARVLPSSREVFFAIREGRAIVINPYGSILIGAGEISSFAYVSSPETPPKFLFSRPAELDPEQFRLPSGAIPMQTAPPVLIRPSPGPTTAPAPAPGVVPGGVEGGPAPETDVVGRKKGGGVSIQRGC